ncbi:MAG TPA: hypothetical protein VI980_09680, partial [Acidimicrobiia bacterium]|nr:hypothetical protein [Acidimicrobiia bacterium]
MKLTRTKRRIALSATALLVVLTGMTPAQAADNQVTITGGGWGHGIGMSQWGAKAMADGGSNTLQILQHFYTGATIGTVGSGELVGHA